MESGKVTLSFGGADKDAAADDLEEDGIYAFALSPDNLLVVTSHRSGLLKLWTKADGSLVKMWRGIHNGPIQQLAFSANSSLIATGGSDTIIRVWNHEHKMCVASLKGCQGVVCSLIFHPDPDRKIVIAVGDNNLIIGWSFETRSVVFTLTGHFSKVTSLLFSNDQQFLVSTGRDKVVIVWDIEANPPTQKSTIPLMEPIEGGVILKDGTLLPDGHTCKKGKIYIVAGGTEGVLKVWEITKGKLIYSQTNSIIQTTSDAGEMTISQLMFNEQTALLATVTVDHMILIQTLETFDYVKQIIGYHDDILDLVVFGEDDRYLAMATNSKHIKLYDTQNMNCRLLLGHTDIVLSLAAINKYIVSSSKDNTIRLWSVDFENFGASCVAIGAKHTASVGSVSFGMMSHTLCASVSQDTCLKVWKVPKKFFSNEILELSCSGTQIVHEKDVNCVSVSPNDKLIATGSQDKTAKLWDATNLSLVGVFRGHRRGVWSVRFSPIDQVLLTTSADASIKLWSLTHMTCVKTLEGHESSVLKGEFIGNGTQILSAAADGIIKVWSIKTSDCCTTLEHDCKIWSIAVPASESYFYSGGSDSQLIKWKDVTDELKQKQFQERQDLVLEDQTLNNLLKEKKLLKALKYSLRLERPLLTLRIITDIMRTGEEAGLEETVTKLNELHRETLFKHATSWNTNSRNCRPAQLILAILLKQTLTNEYRPPGLQKIVEESLPYTERHFKRITEYVKDLKFLEYTIKCMQPTFNVNDQNFNDM